VGMRKRSRISRRKGDSIDVDGAHAPVAWKTDTS
jgi:hypothetical protein